MKNWLLILFNSDLQDCQVSINIISVFHIDYHGKIVFNYMVYVGKTIDVLYSFSYFFYLAPNSSILTIFLDMGINVNIDKIINC